MNIKVDIKEEICQRMKLKYKHYIYKMNLHEKCIT